MRHVPSPRILVTHQIPAPAAALLKRFTPRVEINAGNRDLSHHELLRRLRHADGLLCMLTDRIDAELILKSPRLKAISVCAAGYNNIDIAAAARRGIAVTNTPGVLSETTADLTWALLLSVARRIPEADRYTRRGKFKGWAPLLFLGMDLHGKTLGIVGAGRIGTAVALRSRGFRMRVLYTRAHGRNAVLERELSAKRTSLRSLLRESDFVSLHIPLTPATKHLIGAAEIALMKSTACLVNTARGPVIDEKALARALASRRIAGAGLDVYENEPRFESALKKLDNAVLLPHIGSATLETRTRMALTAAENLIDALSGRTPANLIQARGIWDRRPPGREDRPEKTKGGGRFCR